jgi:hypothetical protein
MMRSAPHHVLCLSVVWIVAAIYLRSSAYRGWIPTDEGSLAHSAERVLGGELPHRDFDELYTGGLSLFYALGFAVLGVKLSSIRTVLLLCSLLWVPAVYLIAARFVPPPIAGLVALLCVAWSVPNYFAGLPSWYNLFLATFGTLALLRHLDTGRGRWLIVAGLCGGFSFLVKSIGVYYVAAAILFLVYREQVEVTGEQPSARFTGVLVVKALGAAVFLLLLLALVYSHLAPMEVLHFVLPGGALCGLLLWSEWRDGRGPFRMRAARFGRPLLTFGVGVLAPIAPFLLPYCLGGSLPELWRGVFVLPQRRLEAAAFPLPPVWTLVAALPITLTLACPVTLPRRLGHVVLGVVVLLLAAVLVSADHESVANAVWYSIRPICPATLIIGCRALGSAGRAATLPPRRRLELFLLLAVAALVSLVQYPYAHRIYFCYGAPLVILAVVALEASTPGAPTRLHLCLLAFYLLFAITSVHAGNTRGLAGSPGERATLALDRGGLEVRASDAELYARLVNEIHLHAGPGTFIYATPDCPQVYFLSARRNPTRTLYDFFDQDVARDLTIRTRRILSVLEEKDVKVVVINWTPDFTTWIARDLLDALLTRFPYETALPRYSVRWRD